MSEGPIHQWWKSHTPAKVSTANADRVCALRLLTASYCGRKSRGASALTSDWESVTCADCHAALRADAAVPGGES